MRKKRGKTRRRIRLLRTLITIAGQFADDERDYKAIAADVVGLIVEMAGFDEKTVAAVRELCEDASSDDMQPAELKFEEPF